MGQVFIKTRKRDPEKKYKTPTEVVQLKIANVEKIISSTTDRDTVDKLFCEANTSHGPSWLIGRHVKIVNRTNVGKDNYAQELTFEIRKQLADEMEEKVNKKVLENMRKLLKQLGEVNPNFNLNVEALCTSNSSDGDDHATPMTEATAMAGTSDTKESS
ncbi:hypothetical protein POM88_031858 [Heracleum sosnowskyi]|uniref:Uncharacterized protein n=1 Tax=Heracleum sosnowskyi TaxID=360622 RepID=A0AAD8HZ08_9APIA|nr:hypothetical protein POM88_031858 [Heracleum sosnowskyi]